jgi:hypothetical protein
VSEKSSLSISTTTKTKTYHKSEIEDLDREGW